MVRLASGTPAHRRWQSCPVTGSAAQQHDLLQAFLGERAARSTSRARDLACGRRVRQGRPPEGDWQRAQRLCALGLVPALTIAARGAPFRCIAHPRVRHRCTPRLCRPPPARISGSVARTAGGTAALISLQPGHRCHSARARWHHSTAPPALGRGGGGSAAQAAGALCTCVHLPVPCPVLPCTCPDLWSHMSRLPGLSPGLYPAQPRSPLPPVPPLLLCNPALPRMPKTTEVRAGRPRRSVCYRAYYQL
jgi:hypothetical protein